VWLSPWNFGIEALKMVIKTIKELMEQRSEKGILPVQWGHEDQPSPNLLLCLTYSSRTSLLFH